MAKIVKRNLLLKEDDLVINPYPRVPICLCLDTSGSMGRTVGGTRTGEKIFSDGQEWNVVTGGKSAISELQAGIVQFYDALRKDEIARYSAEVAIVTFDDKATCVEDFASIDRKAEVPKLSCRGNTAIGEGVNLALDLLEKRKEEYRKKGVDYYQPWLVLMTDGEPNGDREELFRAVSRTCESVNARKLTVIPIGIGSKADIEALNAFSPKMKAGRLQGMEFRNFFTWLSRSVSQTSRSVPGDEEPVNIEEMKKCMTIAFPETDIFSL